MKNSLIGFILTAVWAAGGFGWSSAELEDGAKIAPRAIIWPLIAVNEFGRQLYAERKKRR